jgi:hypothetical protein
MRAWLFVVTLVAMPASAEVDPSPLADSLRAAFGALPAISLHAIACDGTDCHATDTASGKELTTHDGALLAASLRGLRKQADVAGVWSVSCNVHSFRHGIRREICDVLIAEGDDALSAAVRLDAKTRIVSCRAGACRVSDESGATDVADPRIVDALVRRAGGRQALVSCEQWMVSNEDNTTDIVGCDVKR